MTETTYQQHILDTIDHLRNRKARPDAERIFHALTKKYYLSFIDAKTALEKAVQNGSVLRVEYKGNISYRNAAKKNIKRDSQGDNSGGNRAGRKFTTLVTNAIADLVLQEPDYLDVGVPANELIKNILSKDSVKYTKKYVSILLDKEVESGGLIKMENGNFLVGPTKSEPPHKVVKQQEKQLAQIEDASGEDLDLNKFKKKSLERLPIKASRPEKNLDYSQDDMRNDSANLRVGGRRKKAKKVFDPSDSNIPKKRGRPIGSLNKSTIEKQLAKMSDSDSRPESRSSLNGREQGGVCSVCHLQNKKGPNDRMIACRECSNKAHYSCLNGGDMMLRMYPDNTWQCPHCKTCVVCFETSDAGFLAVCNICADAYHIGCHQPRITEKIKPESKWLCINCQMPDELAVNDIQIGFRNIISKDFTDEQGQDGGSPYSGSSSRSNYRSLNSSPSPRAMSPELQKNGSPEYLDSKCNMSDSQSIKDEDPEDNIDPSIPDASNWTCDEVYGYFRQYFPDEDAKIFKDQEIDGRSLLLLRRGDIVHSSKLRLGTALKMFKHVIKLQYRRDDPRLYWL